MRKLNAPKKIISATLDEKTTCASNKIQKECRDQCENKGIYFPDHFSFESVKERLDFYDVSNTPNVQALADVMIMLCVRPAVETHLGELGVSTSYMIIANVTTLLHKSPAFVEVSFMNNI